jgi:hypothetical protein
LIQVNMRTEAAPVANPDMAPESATPRVNSTVDKNDLTDPAGRGREALIFMDLPSS